MTHTFRKHDRHSERGVALLVAIFTLLLITAIGAGMIMLTNTDTITSPIFEMSRPHCLARKPESKRFAIACGPTQATA